MAYSADEFRRKGVTELVEGLDGGTGFSREQDQVL